ncbi:helix-turn-helix domain-containing protein [Pseudomonadota bacterium]
MSETKINEYIGKRLKEKREQMGVTQKRLGKSAGISFQQIQKYENGTNRIPAENLVIFSQFLFTEISYFVEGLDILMMKENDKKEVEEKNKINKEIGLVSNYFSKISKESRQIVITLARNLAKGNNIKTHLINNN